MTIVLSSNTVFYINGSSFGTNSVQPNPQNVARNFRIASHDGTAFFNGIIDDFRIYNRALADAEVSSMVYLDGTTYKPRLAYRSGQPMTDADCAIAYAAMKQTNYSMWAFWEGKR